jgi:hypothetical protein
MPTNRVARYCFIGAAIWIAASLAYDVLDPGIPSLLHSCNQLRGFTLDVTRQKHINPDDLVRDCEQNLWPPIRARIILWLLVPSMGLLLVGGTLSLVRRPTD